MQRQVRRTRVMPRAAVAAFHHGALLDLDFR